MQITIDNALTELGISAIVQNNNYETIQWFCEESEIPSKETVENKIAEMQSAEDATQYQRDRANAYPSWQDQMDLLYHGGIDALKAELKKTKDKYPKPT